MHERFSNMQHEYFPPHQLVEGLWGEVPWKFMVEYMLPSAEDVTAVFGVVAHRGKLVIIRHHDGARGWELPGGHREPGEKILEALWRELREEAGVVGQPTPRYFGYKEVSPTHPIPRRAPDTGFYPFPHSYVPYYAVEAPELDLSAIAEDVADVKLVTLDHAGELLVPDQKHLLIATYAINRRLIEVER